MRRFGFFLIVLLSACSDHSKYDYIYHIKNDKINEKIVDILSSKNKCDDFYMKIKQEELITTINTFCGKQKYKTYLIDNKSGEFTFQGLSE